MNLFLIRHGESALNEHDESVGKLTENGIKQMLSSAMDVSAIYTSPSIRTLESAEILRSNLLNKPEIIVDSRIKRIDYGIYPASDDRNKRVASRQVNGDFNIRFGKTGENKDEIFHRLGNFIISLANNYSEDANVAAISHGRIISIMSNEILNLSNIHLPPPNNAEVREYPIKKERIEDIKLKLLKFSIFS